MSTVIIHAGSATAADDAAGRNWHANIEALQRTQVHLAKALVETPLPPLTWTIARDGALSARDAQGMWFDECSVPRRAAAEMLRSLSQPATTGCFVLPASAWLLDAALSILKPQQALIAIVPDLARLKTMLHCCDLSAAIAAHRVWFAAGRNWPAMLTAILAENPGLPVPHQFIRTVLTGEEESQPIMQLAQRIFAAETRRRAGIMEHALEAAPSPAGPLRLCVLGPSQFRLWDEAAETIVRAIESAGDAHCVRVDTDDPAAVSAAGLALAAANCHAVLTANAFRGELPPVVSPHIPLITWVTVPRIAPPVSAARRDMLLLADGSWRNLARNAGWPDRAIEVAAWPACAPMDKPADAPLAIIADTETVLPPPGRFELSSHRLLWEAVAAELLSDPFSLGRDLAVYLLGHMRRIGLSEEGFDWHRFIDRLVVPAFQQGIARCLASAGIAIALHGRGWDGAPELRKFWLGPVADRRQLLAAVAGAAALVHVWPVPGVHPMDAMPRPVLRAFGRTRGAFLEEARRVATARREKHFHAMPLGGQRLVELVRRALSAG